MLLRQAYEQVRTFVTTELHSNGYYETLDGRPLSQCSLAELQQILTFVCNTKKKTLLQIA